MYVHTFPYSYIIYTHPHIKDIHVYTYTHIYIDMLIKTIETFGRVFKKLLTLKSENGI